MRFADQPGGNYRLADGSRYRKGAGKDAGVDVDALVAAGALDAGGRGPRCKPCQLGEAIVTWVTVDGLV